MGARRPWERRARGFRGGAPARTEWLAATFAVAIVLGFAAIPSARAADAVLDPRLAAAAGSAAPARVWVVFRDKGESSGRDRADRLAAAERSLTPRARARRVRARVHPLVDAGDLPVHAPYLEALAARGIAPDDVSRWFNRAAVEVPGTRLAELAALPFVRRVAPVERALRAVDPVREGFSAPRPVASAALAATDYGRLATAAQQLGLAAVHDSGYVAAGILICVFDDGFNWIGKHEALRGIDVPPGMARDFIAGDTLVADTTQAPFLAHGSQMLALLGARLPGGYVGTAWGATFALARTEDDFTETRAEPQNWVRAAEWADSLGADVISSSVGYTEFDDPLTNYRPEDLDGRTTEISRAAGIAAAHGILVVNSAGNYGNRTWRLVSPPADVHGDSLIAVGAVDAAGAVANFSSYGPTADGRVKPDLVALGVDVALVSQVGSPQEYDFASGTSISAPLVAGLAACLLGARPDWTPQQVIRALRETASHAGSPDFRHGYGIPNGAAALRWPEVLPAPPAVAALAFAGPNPVRLGAGPARVRATLGSAAAAPAPARVFVTDAQGRRVRDLWSGVLAPGGWSPEITWSGEDGDGRAVDAGIYWIVLTAAGERASRRIAALR